MLVYLDADPAEPLHLPLLAVVHPVVAPGVEEHLAVAAEEHSVDTISRYLDIYYLHRYLDIYYLHTCGR